MFMEKKLSIVGTVIEVQQVKEYTNKETGKTTPQSIRLYFNMLENGRPNIFSIKVKEITDIEDQDLLGLVSKKVQIDNVEEVGFKEKYYSCFKTDIGIIKTK